MLVFADWLHCSAPQALILIHLRRLSLADLFIFSPVQQAPQGTCIHIDRPQCLEIQPSCFSSASAFSPTCSTRPKIALLQLLLSRWRSQVALSPQSLLQAPMSVRIFCIGILNFMMSCEACFEKSYQDCATGLICLQIFHQFLPTPCVTVAGSVLHVAQFRHGLTVSC